MIKICNGCKKELLEENFYSHPRGGYRSKCKECWSKNVKIWKAKNPLKCRAWAARYQKEHPDRVRGWGAKAAKKWKALNKDKRKAQHKISNGVRDGKIKRQRCVVCIKLYDKKTPGHAHHCDYNKPLEAMWLCPKHHAAWHNVFLAEQAVQ